LAWTGEKSLRFVTLRSSRLTRHAQIGCALVQRRLPARRRGLPQDGAGQRTAHWQPCQCERRRAQGISHQDRTVAGDEMSIHMRTLCVQINIIFTFRYTETGTATTWTTSANSSGSSIIITVMIIAWVFWPWASARRVPCEPAQVTRHSLQVAPHASRLRT
jgi:hypothetical protein